MTQTQEPGTPADATKKPERHRVFDYDTTPICDWGEWRSVWDDPKLTPEIRLGLLHASFNVPIVGLRKSEEEAAGDRLCLLLELADGHSRHNFFDPDDTLSRAPEREEQRNKLVRKALSLLVAHYFNDPREQGDAHNDEPRWISQIELPGVLEKTIWFFRPNQHGSVDNLPQRANNHQSKALHGFASRLWRLGWNYNELKATWWGNSRQITGAERAFRTRLMDSRSQLLHLVLLLDEGDTFINNEPFLLDHDCRERLLDLAYLPIYDRTFGQITPDSLEQAFFLGSSAARLLLLCHHADEERDRLREIKETVCLAKENDARLAVLRRSPQSGKPIAEVVHQADDSS